MESTLSGKTLLHKIRDAKSFGFQITIMFVFLESADACVDRVAARCKQGGHDVPEADIRRRFGRSLVNFWEIYRDLSDHWLITNNSGRVPIDVAIGTADTISIRDTAQFRLLGTLLATPNMPAPANLETYWKTDEVLNVFRAAVREAQEESHRRGVPNVYYFDGVRYFEFPDGEIRRLPRIQKGAEQWDEREGSA